MHIHQASLRQTQQTNWVIIPLTSHATNITLSILMYFLCNLSETLTAYPVKPTQLHRLHNQPPNPVNRVSKLQLQATKTLVQTFCSHRMQYSSLSDTDASSQLATPDERTQKCAEYHFSPET